jgi:SAM-dependent methyltransferase
VTPDADPAFRATLRRSVGLFSAFRKEQTEPDVFYGALAQDSAAQVASYLPLEGARLLDVGGGPGYFADAFEARGATYVPLDADAGELALHGREPGPRTVLGDGTALPFLTASFDVSYSSNVAEHVAEPWRMADEMVRVTRPGGLVFLSYTLWFGPWGGHETSPWHYLGGARAADRYERRHGHRPKNDFGRSMYRTTAAAGARWAARQRETGRLTDVQLVPRYLPGWAAPVGRLPGVREVVCWNLVVVGRRGR